MRSVLRPMSERRGSRARAESTGNGVRLQLYMARCGVGSRRHCEEIIASGSVAVNGRVVMEQGTRVGEGDVVTWKGRRIVPVARHVYYALNKPAGYLCANQDAEGRPLAIDLLKSGVETRLFHVGRLDFLSTGLILFTNDGEFARVVSHPSYRVRKEYVVDTVQALTDEQLERYRKGVRGERGAYRLLEWKRLDPRRVVLVLEEGKNREIREVLKIFGVQARRVHRQRVGPVTVKGLAFGQFRPLRPREVSWFLHNSSQKPGGDET